MPTALASREVVRVRAVKRNQDTTRKRSSAFSEYINTPCTCDVCERKRTAV